MEYIVGVNCNSQSLLIGFGFDHDIYICHFLIDFVMFQNNKVLRIVSSFKGTLSVT